MRGSVGYDLLGRRFGRLTIIGRNPETSKSGHIQWDCACDCGAKITVLGTNLVKGNTKSCGCLALETRTKHGMHGSPEYGVWEGMIQRCTNPKHKQYCDYGERGITVCKRWLDSFENFYNDMGSRPDGEYTIDRIDNDKGYGPNNCRWVTRKEQANNRRNTVFYEYKGKKYTISELAELPEVKEKGININTLKGRLRFMGLSVEYAINTPVQARSKRA